MEELKIACTKFLNKQYGVEELSRTFAWIAVPTEIQELVSDAESRLERIRFCISDDKQYEEGLKIVEEILAKVSELE
ncbi:hypothetical protein IMX26_03630 [Clostridium sp. 'deep sea']|uniref:hypothetical protein n=1 Tax=Clostridium sp. 'deep sea' TaxID=2779445 RepID=UPI0018965FDF|nr:hypothetical protein [Clostridium sp. 'deep sea']QOR35921.1 hypothetical protein IMX26_03630 [Clostridium sp. 'deep sea']